MTLSSDGVGKLTDDVIEDYIWYTDIAHNTSFYVIAIDFLIRKMYCV